jgi:hypothetical protein
METDPNEFLATHPLRTLVAFPQEYLDEAMALAFQSFQAGRYEDTVTLCKGLIAIDNSYWWSYSLYAGALARLGKVREALVQINLGLAHEPDQPKLLAMKREILTTAAALGVRAQRPTETMPVAAVPTDRDGQEVA